MEITWHKTSFEELSKDPRRYIKFLTFLCKHELFDYIDVYETAEHSGGYRVGKRCKRCGRSTINMVGLGNIGGLPDTLPKRRRR